MKKLGIDRSTDLSYSNSRSRELRPDQSSNFRIDVPALRKYRASRLINKVFGQQLYSTAALGNWGGFSFGFGHWPMTSPSGITPLDAYTSRLWRKVMKKTKGKGKGRKC